jgi:hypothetical protein
MKKQTAVEWYAIQLAIIGVTEELIGHLTLEAKEMEKQQIIDSFNKGFITDQWDKSKENKAEQYYNETFNKK